MISVEKVNKNIKTNNMDDKIMNSWFMRALSRDDFIGYAFATLVSGGGIWLMLYIYRM